MSPKKGSGKFRKKNREAFLPLKNLYGHEIVNGKMNAIYNYGRNRE